jgi:hypothetical protein
MALTSGIREVEGQAPEVLPNRTESFCANASMGGALDIGEGGRERTHNTDDFDTRSLHVWQAIGKRSAIHRQAMRK